MSNQGPPNLRIGMSFDEVCSVLGQPIGTNPGSAVLGGKGQVIGATTRGGLADIRSRLYHTKYASWRRPEGQYDLVFEYEKLARISRAPDGVRREGPETMDNVLPARFVWVVTNGGKDTPKQVFEIMRREGEILVTSDAIVIGDVLRDVAVDLSTNRVMTRASVCALKALKSADKGEEFLDMDSMRVHRFRRGRGTGSAGVIVMISGPTHDPAARASAIVGRKKQREICGKCGITLAERMKEWNAPAPAGVAKIGGERGAFMFCPQCKEGICGKCSIDLGMTAGCPRCHTELIYMDGGRQ